MRSLGFYVALTRVLSCACCARLRDLQRVLHSLECSTALVALARVIRRPCWARSRDLQRLMRSLV